MEIDDDNIPEGSTKTEQIILLKTQLKSLLNKIISNNSLQILPRTIRAIAYIFQKYASVYSPESRHILIGGFIFLRFFFFI